MAQYNNICPSISIKIITLCFALRWLWGKSLLWFGWTRTPIQGNIISGVFVRYISVEPLNREIRLGFPTSATDAWIDPKSGRDQATL